MEYGQFIEHVNRLKVLYPIWFELDTDPIGTAADIQATENQLNIYLSEKYKKFIGIFCGGYFAFTIIYSVSPDSEWNIVKQNRSLD